MAEGRMLKKRIAKSKKIAALKTDSARFLYLAIYPHVDIEGRIEADIEIIRGDCIPRLRWTNKKIDNCLEDLDRIGLIVLYEIEGHKYLEITRFSDFQTLRKDREAESEIPPPPAELQRNSSGTPPEVKLSKVKLSKVKKDFFVPDSKHLELANLLKTEILKNNPKAKITDSQINKWVDTIRVMVERDKRTLEEIKDLIVWAQSDSFWKCNILSMQKLRKQFDQITLKAKEKKKPDSPNNEPSSEALKKTKQWQKEAEREPNRKKEIKKIVEETMAKISKNRKGGTT